MRKEHATEIVDLARESQVWCDAVVAAARELSIALQAVPVEYEEALEAWEANPDANRGPKPEPDFRGIGELTHRLVNAVLGEED